MIIFEFVEMAKMMEAGGKTSINGEVMLFFFYKRGSYGTKLNTVSNDVAYLVVIHIYIAKLGVMNSIRALI